MVPAPGYGRGGVTADPLWTARVSVARGIVWTVSARSGAGTHHEDAA